MKDMTPKDELIDDLMAYGVAITHTDSNGNIRLVKPDTEEFFKVIKQSEEKER